MAIEDRVLRERAARRALIVSTARSLAETEGWDAVTTRRLSTEIEYSQPVLYKHFAAMDDLLEAVALEGFRELADVLTSARQRAIVPEDELHQVCHEFSRFADENPRLYEAMFIRTSRLQFAAADTPAPMVAAFNEIREAAARTSKIDLDARTEVLWAALHGLAILGQNGRLTADAGDRRVDILVNQFRVG